MNTMQYGTWERGKHSITRMLQVLEDSMAQGNLELDDIPTEDVNIRVVYRPPIPEDLERSEFTAIKITWKAQNE